MCSSQPWCADGRAECRLTRRAHAGARACEVEEFGGHGAMIAHGFRGRTGPFAGCAAAQGASRCPGTVCSRTASLTEEMGMQSVESRFLGFPFFLVTASFFTVFFWRRVLYEMDACKVLYYMVRRRSLYCPARRGA